MKTKNIFKALALAILMPALLLNTACNSDIINNENTDGKGYALPVTVNVTRQGDDPATKVTYTDNGNGTGSLAFSAGDKLFVYGNYNSGKTYAGTLDYVSATGKFSGTIYTQNEWENSADALFSSAESIYATLLPAGYDSYNFLSIDDQGTSEEYDDEISISKTNSFVASATAKATGVEQLSLEQATTYSSGFALAPQYAILNFTISGLSAGAKNVTLKVYDGDAYSVRGSVTPTSGIATFAMGVPNSTNIRDATTNLTIGSSNFKLPSNINFDKGKIYNITRSTLTYPIALSAVTSSYVCSIVTTDGNVYATVAAASAASKTAAAMIAYVSGTGHGLALALDDEASTMNWDTATGPSGAAAHTPIVTSYSWKLPSQEDWNNMITAAGSYTALRDGFSSFGGTNMNAGTYWSSTDAYTTSYAQLKYGYKFNEGSWGTFGSTSSQNTRACLAF